MHKCTSPAVYRRTRFAQSPNFQPVHAQWQVIRDPVADRGDGTKATRRFPLLSESGTPIRALQAARDAIEALKAKRVDGALPQSGIKPPFDDFAADRKSVV